MEDNIAPVVVTKDITRTIGASGKVTIQPEDVLNFNCSTTGISSPQPVPGAGDEEEFIAFNCTSDNCEITTTTIDKPEFDCNDTGLNTVTVTVTDASGNSTTATAQVFIIDNQAPEVTAKDITVALDADGNINITPDMIDGGSNDPCGNINLSISKSAFSCVDIGQNTVTLIASDNNGNSATATATVTIVDNTAPEVVTQNIKVYLDENGSAKIQGKNLLYICDDAIIEDSSSGDRGGRRGPTVTYSEFEITSDVNAFTSCTADNCKITSIAASLTEFDCSHIGENIVTITVTDGNNNVTQKTAIVTVMDNAPPAVVVQNVDLSLNADGQAVLSLEQVEVSANDNCAIDSKVLSKTNFDCQDLGTQQVSLTVTDVNGNVTEKIFSVTISDDIAPTVIAQNFTVSLDENGQASISEQDIDNGSFDNCSLTLSLDRFNFDCEDIGDQIVVLTGTDDSGNTASASAIVTVVDQIKPTITNIPEKITVQLEDNDCEEIVTWTTPQFGDNCGYAVSSTHQPGDSFETGVTTVTYTVTDGSGNATQASFEIEVLASPVQVDLTPVIVNEHLSTHISCEGAADGSINVSVSGGCGAYTYLWSNGATTQNLNNVTAGVYSLTVTDAKGNSTTEEVVLRQPQAIVAETSVSPQFPGGNLTEENTIYLGYGEQTVTLSASASGGNGNFTYEWTPMIR